MSDSARKLKLGALIALVVGSMIGGGIFSLPQNMAASAGAGAVLIGWAITAVGMLTLAMVFQSLANRKPELDAGVYAYAKAGFGDYMGFSSAWGYWISAWIGNVSYFVLLFSTLGIFFPAFGEGNTLLSILCASALAAASACAERYTGGGIRQPRYHHSQGHSPHSVHHHHGDCLSHRHIHRGLMGHWQPRTR